jgi:hypothetical protein
MPTSTECSSCGDEVSEKHECDYDCFMRGCTGVVLCYGCAGDETPIAPEPG